MSQTTRTSGLVSNAAIKWPCRMASTANVVLVGLQTIDAVVGAQDDRVLLKDQTDHTENGIWLMDSGDWNRAEDADNDSSFTEGTIVKVNNGTAGAGYWAVTTTGTITPGDDAIAFSRTFPGAVADPGANGIVVRTASGTSSARTLTGTAAEITVTNGSGVAGNPTLSLPAALTLTGKTMTGGTYSSASVDNTSTVLAKSDTDPRTANTILAAADCGRTIDVTSGTFSQTFTAAATLGDGWNVVVRNSGTGVVTLDPNSTETINGWTTIALNQGDSAQIICDGSNFKAALRKRPTQQVLTSGSSATYTTPGGCTSLVARAAAGGGGGGGQGGAGGTGGTTTFNGVNAIGGGGGSYSTGNAGIGGTGGTGTAAYRAAGNGASNPTVNGVNSGSTAGGGSAFLGGAGSGSTSATKAGAANTGGGGNGGGGDTAVDASSGGGGGECFELVINAPTTSYVYTIGAAGAAGTKGTSFFTPGAGGTGVIIVDEKYN